ncbi:MAG: aldo/keto reductase [Rhodospirillales bacterium]|nr:aldo/keto reductase [Rhodospirillales bacterium]
MQYQRVGVSGLMVSPICLGAMMFGDQTGEKVSAHIIASAADAGINFIDTANVYSKGGSERIVGKNIKKNRDAWVVGTKVGSPMGVDPLDRTNSRKRIMTEAEASLKRLQTDYIDIYYFHRDEPDTPLDEPLSAMGDLIRAGKVRYWGFSNFPAWRIAELVSQCEMMGIPGPIVTQPCYNAMNRMLEVEFLPACRHFGIGVVPYSPLARGVLTGKYPVKGPPPKGTRAGRNDMRILESEYRYESLVLAQKIKERAEKRGMTAGQFALNWVLNNGLVSSVIAGPRTMTHWRDYLGALDHEFTAADERFVEKLVPTGGASTPGFLDPKLPPTGREALTG